MIASEQTYKGKYKVKTVQTKNNQKKGGIAFGVLPDKPDRTETEDATQRGRIRYATAAIRSTDGDDNAKKPKSFAPKGSRQKLPMEVPRRQTGGQTNPLEDTTNLRGTELAGKILKKINPVDE